MHTIRQKSLCAGLVFILPGLSWGACYIGTETNASNVQEDSGNGTYNCTLFSTPDGTLFDVTEDSGYTIKIEDDGTVTWSVDVIDGKPLDVDLVSVSSNSGKRCNYIYGEQTSGGSILTTSNGSAAKYVTICADGEVEPVPPPPPPEPVSTVDNSCDVDFAYDDVTDKQYDVALGYTKDEGVGIEGAAICSRGEGQRQCINECVPRDVPAYCEGLDSRELPLDCAPCEYEFEDPAGSDKDLKYCWYWENRVCTDSPDDPNDPAPFCTSRNLETFIPSPKKKSLVAQIDVTTGSNCYTVTVGPLYGGATYSYQVCP